MSMVRAAQEARAGRTPRLVFSPLDVRHAGALFELLNDWDVVKMLSEVPWPLSYGDVESFLARNADAKDDFILMHESSPIGVMGVKAPGTGDPPRKMPRLGYWIGRKYWRRGFGAEAVSALVDHAFARCPHDRVGAGVFRENTASQRVLQKLGFTAIGPKVTHSRSRGANVEAIEMQITRAEWTDAKARLR